MQAPAVGTVACCGWAVVSRSTHVGGAGCVCLRQFRQCPALPVISVPPELHAHNKALCQVGPFNRCCPFPLTNAAQYIRMYFTLQCRGGGRIAQTQICQAYWSPAADGTRLHSARRWAGCMQKPGD